MRIQSRSRRKLNSLVTSLFFICSITYFAYHAISGDRGLFALVKLTKEAEQARTELDMVRGERLNLGHRVNLMHTESLDLDMLDEQSRKLLGYARGDETIYYVQDGKVVGIK